MRRRIGRILGAQWTRHLDQRRILHLGRVDGDGCRSRVTAVIDQSGSGAQVVGAEGSRVTTGQSPAPAKHFPAAKALPQLAGHQPAHLFGIAGAAGRLFQVSFHEQAHFQGLADFLGTVLVDSDPNRVLPGSRISGQLD